LCFFLRGESCFLQNLIEFILFNVERFKIIVELFVGSFMAIELVFKIVVKFDYLRGELIIKTVVRALQEVHDACLCVFVLESINYGVYGGF
jgi:hypothetical protein